jgi:hypothetical protein
VKPVERHEILDFVSYEEGRESIRESAMRAKDPRRIHVGTHLTFLFENHETMRYQVLEMVRVERMVREADIRHEIETYNELLGGPGELGATLLIEIDDPAERDRKLAAWLDLPSRLYAELEDGTKVRPTFDPRQLGESRLSSVQYIKFAVGGRAPVALGCDHPDPDLRHSASLTETQRAALAQDLSA